MDLQGRRFLSCPYNVDSKHMHEGVCKPAAQEKLQSKVSCAGRC